MKRHEIYEEFRNKLKNETNEDIIKYINELPTPNVSLRYTLGIGFSFAICKGITVQW